MRPEARGVSQACKHQKLCLCGSLYKLSWEVCTNFHLEAMGLDAQQNQALKQGLAEPRSGGLLVDDDGPQLAVVTHQHSLLGAQDQRDQRFWLSSLGCLVH